MRLKLIAGVWTLLVMPALVASVGARQGTSQGSTQAGQGSAQGQGGAIRIIVRPGPGEVVFGPGQRLPRRLADVVMPVPADNPATDAKIALGRRLFFDKQISLDGTVACASCHDPERAFADARPVAVGIQGKAGNRNSQTLVNRGFGRIHFWDGRAATLEAQVLQPIADPNEMAMPIADLVARLSGDVSYGAAFQAVFARPVSTADLGRALAAYLRTIRSADAPYDKFIDGATDALSKEAQLGLTVFRGKARCAVCHREPIFTDEAFYNTGVAVRADVFQDNGRFGVTGIERERGAFKVPTLREVARTAPYMHDGSFATLQDVVEFYDQGGRPNRNLMSFVKPLNLTPEEKTGLVAFLESLSGVVSGKPTAQELATIANPTTEILAVDGDRKTAMPSETPVPRSRNFRFVFIGISKDLMTIDGTKSKLRVTDKSPSFQLALPAGVSPDRAVVLVRLKAKDGRREVGRSRDTSSGLNQDDVVSVKFELAGAGLATSQRYRVVPSSPLKAGEYAIVVDKRFYDFGVN